MCPEGWFCDDHQAAVHVWAPPPTVALIMLKQPSKDAMTHSLLQVAFITCILYWEEWHHRRWTYGEGEGDGQIAFQFHLALYYSRMSSLWNLLSYLQAIAMGTHTANEIQKFNGNLPLPVRVAYNESPLSQNSFAAIDDERRHKITHTGNHFCTPERL